jgi:hydroxymethylbilane synthase
MNFKVELELIVTSGDKMQRGALADIAIDDPNIPEHLKTGKGLFVKEVQEAMLAGKADLAVHSMKDLPVENTSGLRVAAVLPRANPSDTLIFSPRVLQELSDSSKSLQNSSPDDVIDALSKFDWSSQEPIGTTSARRQAFLRSVLPSSAERLTVLRGNVDSRLKRVAANEYAFIMLARAGIDRLELYDESIMMTLPPSLSVPAPAQGVVAIECRDSDSEVRQALSSINDHKAALEAAFERAVLWFTGSGCHTALASHFDQGTVTSWVADVTLKRSMTFNLNESEKSEWQAHSATDDYSDLFRKLIQSHCGKRLYSELTLQSFGSVVTMRQNLHD